MIQAQRAFSGFAVKDLGQAKVFYESLGVPVTEQNGLLRLEIGGTHVLVYPKADHVPATYTILNFPVDDIDKAVDQLAARGITLDRYEGFPQDSRGVLRGRAAGQGPDIGWFRDPSGNILSVLQEP